MKLRANGEVEGNVIEVRLLVEITGAADPPEDGILTAERQPPIGLAGNCEADA